jgi:L-ascorbate metabolism protein UlaG (beta-lactamase superfamily)
MSIRKLMLLLTLVQIVPTLAWAQAGNVKITPLGSRTGNFCALDRALLFEDPTGVRILYDPGDTIRGGDDSRLGAVDAILVSHAHADHLGNVKLAQDPDSPTALCAPGPGFGSDVTPFSNTAQIAAKKNSALIAGSPLATFLGLRIAQVLGNSATPACLATGLTNELIVPQSAPCTGLINPGGKRTLRRPSASAGVQVVAVTAEHPGEIVPAFLTDPLKTDLASNGVSAYGGIANGFVVKFTNGLTAYLTGDTGVISDMETEVNRFYQANLAVINISDTFVNGPEEAAFAIRNLIKPKTAIPSHANEIATTGGVVNPGTRTARFIELLRQPGNDNGDNESVAVFVPRSGITLEFDGQARCRAGCD